MAKRGRPRKTERDRKSITVGIRVTPELFAALTTARKDSGRTLSQESEARLRLSFGERQRVQDEFGGAVPFWLFHQMASVLNEIERQSGRRWRDDRLTFEKCLALIHEVWKRLEPAGKKPPPKILREARADGKRMALGVLAPLELAFGGMDLGAEGFAAGIVARVVRKSALSDVKAGASRFLKRLEILETRLGHRRMTIRELRERAKK